MDFLVLVFIWITWGAAGAYIGQQKGRGPFEGFILGLILGPIGLVIEIWQAPQPPKPPPGRRVVTCPVCNAVQNVKLAAERFECWQCKTGVKTTPVA